MYMIPLILLPTLITGNGIYITRSGEHVIINEINNRRSSFNCQGTYQNGITEHWHTSGRLYASRQSANDIVQPYAMANQS